MPTTKIGAFDNSFLFSPKKQINQKKQEEFLFFRIKKHPLLSAIIFFTFISTLFLLILLLGSSSRNIYLSRFTFNDQIRSIIKKDDMTFTLYGYCVDNNCSEFSFFNNFDKSKY